MYKLLEQYWHTHKSLFFTKNYCIHVVVSYSFATIAMLLCLGSKEVLEWMDAANIQSSPDLLLDWLPSLYTFGIASLSPWVTALLCLWYATTYPRKVPFTLYSLGVLYLLRTVFILLTPLGKRPDVPVNGATNIFSSITYDGYDFFFSGHTAFPFLLLLIFWQDRSARWIFGILTPLIGLSVLLEKIHYSIDVAAAPFIAYGVYGFCRKIWKEDY